MTPQTRDPLLLAARFILVFMIGAMAVLAAACAVAVPAVLVFQDRIVAELAVHGMPSMTGWALASLVALLAACGALGFLFFRHLYRIVGTVAEGDPFIPANAERLSAMGWNVVAVNVLVIPIVAIVNWIETVAEGVHADAHFDLMGVLLALILFILARVFREGARMREELEGTV
jgi:hypothetical protein